MTTKNEKIPAIFVMTNFEKDQLWRGQTTDLVQSLKHFNESDWRRDQLYHDYEECIELVYWKKVDPSNLEQEDRNLKMLTRKQLNKLIEDFNPGWEDLYDTLVPKDPNFIDCPHCGDKIYAVAEE